MNKNKKTAAATGEAINLLNFKAIAERRLDIMSDWMEHIRFADACPLPRSPDQIMEVEIELVDTFKEELEQHDPECTCYQVGVVAGRISALQWVLGEQWDDICS